MRARARRGIVLTTEAMKLLLAAIVFASIAAGASIWVASQGVTAKALITVPSATAYYFGQNNTVSTNTEIVLSITISNMGTTAVKITYLRLWLSQPGTTNCFYQAYLGVELEPGGHLSETVTMVISDSQACGSVILPDEAGLIVYYEFDNGAGEGSVSVDVPVTRP